MAYNQKQQTLHLMLTLRKVYLSISVYLGVIGDYKFTDIGLVQKDTTKNQILVEVQGELARETAID